MWAAADPEGVGKDPKVVELSRMVKEQLESVNKKVNEFRVGARLAVEKRELEAEKARKERDEKIKSKEKELEAARETLERTKKIARVLKHEKN